jgi:hypothetical protein
MQCTECGIGKYSATQGATSVSECIECPVNTFSAVHSSALSECTCNAGYTGPGGTDCTICSAGSYKINTGNNACILCGTGFYSSTEGATGVSTCLVCADNAHSDAGSQSSSDCVCNGGFYDPALHTGFR